MNIKGGSFNYIQIENGQSLNIWEIKQKGTPITSFFPDFWENCLALIPTSNNRPKLIWGSYQEGTEPEEYRVYRCITSGTPQNFALIQTTNYDEYIYVDEEYTIWPSASTKAYYKILPYAPTDSYSYSNTVNTGIAAYKFHHDGILNNADFILYQNCPNSFNPITIINYSINSTSLVTLKVYDLLGTEVTSLVYERKNPGNYTVEFNAKDLSSGIYFYTLTSGNFMATKKLILLK